MRFPTLSCLHLSRVALISSSNETVTLQRITLLVAWSFTHFFLVLVSDKDISQGWHGCYLSFDLPAVSPSTTRPFNFARPKLYPRVKCLTASKSIIYSFAKLYKNEWIGAVTISFFCIMKIKLLAFWLTITNKNKNKKRQHFPNKLVGMWELGHP